MRAGDYEEAMATPAENTVRSDGGKSKRQFRRRDGTRSPLAGTEEMAR